MKTRLVSMIISIAAVAALAACTPTRTVKSAGEQVDDSAVTAKVKTALAQDPATNAFQIDVETFRGTVQLNGFVGSDEMRSAATRVARSVEGVNGVQNNLRVDGSRRTAGEYIDDQVLTARIKAALAADPVVAAHEVNIEVKEGVVQLAGFVDNDEQKDQASSVARRVAGVKKVDNQLEVKQR